MWIQHSTKSVYPHISFSSKPKKTVVSGARGSVNAAVLLQRSKPLQNNFCRFNRATDETRMEHGICDFKFEI